LPSARYCAASAKIEWVTIPGGSFLMGSDEDPDSQPKHRVILPSFQLAKALVTKAQYKACVDAGGCVPPNCQWPAAIGEEDHPVVCVNWYQASQFSAWAGGRLPSEAEWEYAARSAGRDLRYPWGNEKATCRRAVVAGCGKGTAPVCSKPEGNTRQGLCDMAGNAREWTQDGYHTSYEGAPADESAWEEPAGSRRVNRGGSWWGVSGEARAARRDFDDPGDLDDHLGFRPARPLPPPQGSAPAAMELPGEDLRLKAIDDLLSRARPLVAKLLIPSLRLDGRIPPQELESRARRQLQEKCAADFSIDFFTEQEMTSPINDVVWDLRRYYECQAFSQRQPDICRAILRYKSLDRSGDLNLEEKCRVRYIHYTLIQLNVADRPDAAKVCETMPFPSYALDGDTPQEECAWMTAQKPDPACKNPADPALGEAVIKDCLGQRILHADEEACALVEKVSLPDSVRPIYRRRCADAASFRTAYLAKDAGLCGNSLVCRMMMGENICDQYLERMRLNFCPLWVGEKLKDAVARLPSGRESPDARQAEALLSRLDGLMQRFEPKDEPGYLSRREAYNALLKKLEKSLKRSISTP
jgi:hypothetical protein